MKQATMTALQAYVANVKKWSTSNQH